MQIRPFDALRDNLYLVGDTETTGFRLDDEVVEISILCPVTEKFVIDTLVKPTKHIPDDAINIHGITNEMVVDAPTWAEVAAELRAVFPGKQVVYYNASFDVRLTWQSSQKAGLEDDGRLGGNGYFCAMREYAHHVGQMDFLRKSYKWWKLAEAARQMGIPIEEELHRAKADAWLTHRLILAVMAEIDKRPPWEEAANDG